MISKILRVEGVWDTLSRADISINCHNNTIKQKEKQFFPPTCSQPLLIPNAPDNIKCTYSPSLSFSGHNPIKSSRFSLPTLPLAPFLLPASQTDIPIPHLSLGPFPAAGSSHKQIWGERGMKLFGEAGEELAHCEGRMWLLSFCQKWSLKKAAAQSWDNVYAGAEQESNNSFSSSEDWLYLQVWSSHPNSEVWKDWLVWFLKFTWQQKTKSILQPFFMGFRTI